MTENDTYFASFGFSHHELVTSVDTSGDNEGTIELLTCDTCGVVVRAITFELHRDWHNRSAS